MVKTALLAVLTIFISSAYCSLPEDDQFDLEWEEFDDRDEARWEGETWKEPSALERVVKRPPGSDERYRVKLPWETRLSVKSSRRFGNLTDKDIARYDGSPASLTQRYVTAPGRFQFGLVIDKDRFEPSLTDLTRIWTAYRNEKFAAVAGDFHITAGQGLTLWSKPSFRNSFDHRTAFVGTVRNVQPAADSQENSAFTGAAAMVNIAPVQATIFAARTMLDAVIDDSLRVLRLTDGGLHRSPGEERKRDSVREDALGGSLVLSHDLSRGLALSIGIAGIVARYSPPLRPVVSASDRFPLAGKRSGGLGISAMIAGEGFRLGFESAIDRDGHQAWRMAATNKPRGGPVDVSLAMYQYPKIYHNPRASSARSGADPENRWGVAILLSGSPSTGIIDYWKTHVEIERRPWRTSTLPLPSTTSKSSIEAHSTKIKGLTGRMRYRRSSGVDGAGDAMPMSSFADDRLRLIIDRPIDRLRFNRLSIWMEGAERRSKQEGTLRGTMAGIRAANQPLIYDSKRWGLTARLSLTYFLTKGELPLYLGEMELPDQISTVRVSGRGVRLSSSITLQRAGKNWLGVRLARTYRFENTVMDGDLELYLTASLILSSE